MSQGLTKCHAMRPRELPTTTTYYNIGTTPNNTTDTRKPNRPLFPCHLPPELIDCILGYIVPPRVYAIAFRNESPEKVYQAEWNLYSTSTEPLQHIFTIASFATQVKNLLHKSTLVIDMTNQQGVMCKDLPLALPQDIVDTFGSIEFEHTRLTVFQEDFSRNLVSVEPCDGEISSLQGSFAHQLSRVTISISRPQRDCIPGPGHQYSKECVGRSKDLAKTPRRY